MSFKNTLKGLLKTVAPTIATAVGGPMGGVAMKFLADKFVGGDTGKVEDFLLAANPEQLAQLKLADMEFQKEMKKLDIDLEQIATEDRASARDLAKTKGFMPQVIMSGVYTFGYFGIIWAFMQGYIAVPDQYSSMFTGMLGVLGAAQIQIINFWFGSSAGSKAKSDAMAMRTAP